MKIAIITDTHYGCRKNSKLFHDYFKKFYEDVFFPTLDKEKIQTIVHMGDAFDSRKGVDFSALSWAKNNIFDPIKKRGIDMHLIVGNHDAYYKNTNQVNAVDLLLREYSNVNIISEPTEQFIDKLKVLFVPWINQENEERTMKIVASTKASIVMGHLELQGFRANSNIIMEHGLDSNIFKNFKKVFSGHYHTRSNKGNVFYLGNPYEMFWTDLNDTRGFNIFDTETLKHTPINNPYRLFYSIYYEDTPYQTFNTTEYENKIVKVIVRKKTNSKNFEKFIDKLYDSNVAELKVIENFEIKESEEFDVDAFESEDTLSILNRYVNEAEINLDKSIVQKLLQEVYQEACELV
jgi:DNA repair exonuclease SbcCD nuclease subunit